MQPSCSRRRGFTLIELMIGIVLSLLTVLVITQVLSMAEGRARTAAMGSDAQTSGSLALLALQRDIEMSGYGFAAANDSLGCPVKFKGDASAGGGFVLAPVIITHSENGPDTIRILRSGAMGASAPIPLTATTDPASTSAPYLTDGALGVRAGDLMVVVPDSKSWESNSATSWCTLSLAANAPGTPETMLTPVQVPYAVEGPMTPDFPSVPYRGSPSATDARAYLLNMGTLVSRTYSISSKHNLQVLEGISGGTATDAFNQIVNMKAMYGKDTDGNGVVDHYDVTTPSTNAQWLQVQSIRVAIVARSEQYEKDEVTMDEPQWDVGGTTTYGDSIAVETCGSSKCVALPVAQVSASVDPDQWKHFRYKVYDTVVPLRNMLWNLSLPNGS